MFKALRLSTLAASLLCATASHSDAQFFIGAGGYGYQYQDLGFYPGLQARIGFEANAGTFTTNAGFSYSPAAQIRTFSVPFTNSATQAVEDVQYTQRVKVLNLFLHEHINLGSEEWTFQPGGVFGFAFDEYSTKYEAQAVPAGFSSPISGEFTDTTFGAFYVDLGLKGNYRIGPGAIYAEAIVGLPVFKNWSGVAAYQRDASRRYGLNVGYKFYIGNWRFTYRNGY